MDTYDFNSRPSIAVSVGDPSGIGPEVSLKALVDTKVRNLAQWILVGDAWQLHEIDQHIGSLSGHRVTDVGEVTPDMDVVILDTDQLDRRDYVLGKVSAACGQAGLTYVRTAAELCLADKTAAMVTAPLNKEAVSLTVKGFIGHTEFIAELCGRDESRMLLANDRLCVVHVSTHCSLATATQLSTDRILQTIQLGAHTLEATGKKAPRIAVCGLNPHAGEHGMFGKEESEFILPAIEAAQAEGIDVSGPWPADTLFVQAVRGKYDLVVAMYHDQGHVPMKLLDFEHTVNVTLGLPIIRVSVDHGTAYDIVGTNQADAEDMKTAMRFAAHMVSHRDELTQRFAENK